MKEQEWQKECQTCQRLDVLEEFVMDTVDVEKLKEWLELPVVQSKKIEEADGRYELVDIGGSDDKGHWLHLIIDPRDDTVLIYTKVESDETYSVGYLGGGRFKVKKVEFTKRAVSREDKKGIEKSVTFLTAGKKRQQSADFSIIFWGREE